MTPISTRPKALITEGMSSFLNPSDIGWTDQHGNPRPWACWFGHLELNWVGWRFFGSGCPQVKDRQDRANAKVIIEAAKRGECDSIRLCHAAINSPSTRDAIS